MTNFSEPFVSFCIPVYNLEKYIGECLDSILSQPFDDYEIVLVNNNSTDKSDSICKEYASRYNQIRYFSLTGKPIYGRAIVFGISNAKGKYIHYIDADDMIPPDLYLGVYNTLKAEEPDVLIGSFDTFSAESLMHPVDRRFNPEFINCVSKDSALEYLSQNMPFHAPLWRFVVRAKLMKEVFDSISQAPFNTYMDNFISVNFLSSADSLYYYTEKPIYLYRLRSQSRSHITPVEEVAKCTKFLCYLSSLNKSPLVKTYFDMYLWTLSVALVATDLQCIEQVTDDINDFLDHPWVKQKLSNLNEPSHFIENLASQGVLSALTYEYEKAYDKISQVVKECLNSKIYIAPGGAMAMYLKAALEDQGVKIAGIFDNDIKKDGMVYEETIIQPPGAVKQAEQAVVIVGSRFTNVQYELKQQFITLGLSENNLIIVEF